MSNQWKKVAVVAAVAVIGVVLVTRGPVVAAIGGALVAAGAWLLRKAFGEA